MQKINIIQFLPYFPPHKWWVETVAEEFSSIYVSKWYGEVINVVFDIEQNDIVSNLSSSDLIRGSDNEKPIWYKQNWYTIYLLPAFDIIPNFPVPKFWKKKFWEVLRILKWFCHPELVLGSFIKQSKSTLWNNSWIIQTHTRFFLSSFFGGLFSKYYKLKWVHIEHWSDYVKLWSKFKSNISYIYDRIIWKWIFTKADKIVAISEWVKKFIENEFINREVEIIYRWLNFIPWKRVDNLEVIKIWFVWRLVKLKWVDLLIDAFRNLEKKYPNKILEIVWDWEERKYLESIKTEKIKFLWFQNREYVKNFLAWTDILVNPSYQEWLPTTVLEWLLSKCVVVATDVWGTKEISSLDDLIIVKSWNIFELEKWLEKAIINYKEIRWKSSELVKEKFDWWVIIAEYFNLYKKL